MWHLFAGKPKLQTENPIHVINTLINYCWSIFKWCLGLAFAAALLAGAYLYLELDNELRRHVQRLLAQHYQGLEVEVGSARLRQGRGFDIYDVTISQPLSSGHRLKLVNIDEVSLTCPARIEDLLQGRLRVRRVVAKRAELFATKRPDGTWTVQALWPPPRFGDRPPEIEVRYATIQLRDGRAPELTPAPIRGVDVKLTPISADQHQISSTVPGQPPARPIRRFSAA